MSGGLSKKEENKKNLRERETWQQKRNLKENVKNYDKKVKNHTATLEI